MEHESVDPNQYYYAGGGAYYSAQIMRSMSMTGAQGTSGPGSPPGSDPLAAVGTSGLPLAAKGVIDAGQGAALGLGVDLAISGATAGESSAAGPVGVVVGAAYFLANLFYDNFSSGSPDHPPNYWTFQFRLNRPHGGRHPLYTAMIGVSNSLLVDQASTPEALPQDDAPSANQYYEWAKTANWLQNLVNLYEFQRGGSLDAQGYGASQAYGNYVFGVYMAARGYQLWFTLRSAEAYELTEDYSKYHRPMSTQYPGIPAANVANITRGFDDERAGKFGLP